MKCYIKFLNFFPIHIFINLFHHIHLSCIIYWKLPTKGTFLAIFVFQLQVVLPVMYFIPGDDPGGRYENSIDALYQLGNSPKLLIFCILYLISIAFYNYFGLAVTKSLTGKSEF